MKRKRNQLVLEEGLFDRTNRIEHMFGLSGDVVRNSELKGVIQGARRD